MKRMFLVLAFTAASPVFANDVDPNGVEKQAYASSVSSAEVRSELRQAQRDGTLPYGEVSKAVNEKGGGGAKSRAEVQSDLIVARTNGKLNYGENYDPLVDQPKAMQIARR